jgi:glycosyltransferase involved in cell wall biosynthesis
MNILVSHPTGNRNVRAIVQSFYEAGILEAFGTTIAVKPDSTWLQFFPAAIRRDLLRRSFQLPSHKIWTYPLREAARMVLPRVGWERITRHEKGWASVDSVYQSFDSVFASRIPALAKKKKIDAVYSYEDGALETFLTAKKSGLLCIYDLPIAYWETLRELLQQEAERMPAWTKTLGGGITDSAEKLARKTKELELADVVVGPGKFVADSLPDWARTKKVIVSPFGSPDVSENDWTDEKPVRSFAGRPLRVLFVGSMGQRKGLGDLMNAMKIVNSRNVELVVMGSLQDSLDFYKSQYPHFTYESGRPHQEVLKLMRSCDVFCLPSIVEGRALVMQEAMSQGLPIIITPNTGGEDLVIEGETGFLVPIRSPEKIAEKISWFAANPQELNRMGVAARRHAASYTWSKYAQTVINELASYLKPEASPQYHVITN